MNWLRIQMPNVTHAITSVPTLGLYFAWYNWCRKHMTLKTTPAVKAGLTDELWSLERLLVAAAAA